MKRSHFPLALVAIVMFSLTGVSAQEVVHLVPEDGPFAPSFPDYYGRVRAILFRNVEAQPLASVVVLPSFAPEWLVCIYHPEIRKVEYLPRSSSHSSGLDSVVTFETDTHKCFVASVVANKSIWQTWMDHPQSRLSVIKPRVSSRSIPVGTADSVCEAFYRHLRETRYTDKIWGGIDGTIYHFAGRHMYAQSWSPQENTNPYKLVKLAEALADYSRADGNTARTLLAKIGGASKILLK